MCNGFLGGTIMISFGMKVGAIKTAAILIPWSVAIAQLNPLPSQPSSLITLDSNSRTDTTLNAGDVSQDVPLLNVWGLDILISNDGFGLGTFYRREFSEDLFGFASFSISESKDDREVERFDPYTGVSFVPGKLKRFLVMPLMFGLQYRLFREEITDNFRPYVNAAVGPTMVFAAPFNDVTVYPELHYIESHQVEFFKSLGRGQAHYTAAAYVGFGANFGTDRTNVFGVNIRYYFAYLFGNGIPSLYDTNTGEVIATKKNFGGFFLTFHVGMAY